MNKFLWAPCILMFLFAATMVAQPAKKRSPLKQTKAAAGQVTLLPAEYEIHATVLKGRGVFSLGIFPASDSHLSLESSFQAFLSDYFPISQGGLRKERREYPKIIIKFMAEDDISTLIDAVRFFSVSEKAVVELESVLEGSRFIVPRKMTQRELDDAKPNPLMLIVEMNVQKNITLNSGKMGNLASLSQLVTTIKDILQARADNGVFKENSNEIEKTVLIKMPLTAAAGDLIKIARALQEAGADPIGLQIYETGRERRLDLIDLPPIPPPRNKNR